MKPTCLPWKPTGLTHILFKELVQQVFVNGRTAIFTRLYAVEDTYSTQSFPIDGRLSLGAVNAIHLGYAELK